MQRANATVLAVVVIVVAVIVAAEWYWFDYRVEKAEYETEGIGPMPEESNLSGDTSNIIECKDEEGNTFFSDADDCEEAKPPPETEGPP